MSGDEFDGIGVGQPGARKGGQYRALRVGVMCSCLRSSGPVQRCFEHSGAFEGSWQGSEYGVHYSRPTKGMDNHFSSRTGERWLEFDHLDTISCLLIACFTGLD